MKALLALAILMTSLNSLASETTVCFKRVYSADHMRANPKQLLKTLEITLTQEESLNIYISAQSKNRSNGEVLFTNGGMCGISQGTIGCEFGGDLDGYLKLEDKDQTARLEITSALKLFSKSDSAVQLKPGKDNGIYILNKVNCNH